MLRYRFTSLLATLLLLMLFSPLVRSLAASGSPVITPLLVIVMFAAVLLSAVFAVREDLILSWRGQGMTWAT